MMKEGGPTASPLRLGAGARRPNEGPFFGDTRTTQRPRHACILDNLCIYGAVFCRYAHPGLPRPSKGRGTARRTRLAPGTAPVIPAERKLPTLTTAPPIANITGGLSVHFAATRLKQTRTGMCTINAPYALRASQLVIGAACDPSVRAAHSILFKHLPRDPKTGRSDNNFRLLKGKSEANYDGNIKHGYCVESNRAHGRNVNAYA